MAISFAYYNYTFSKLRFIDFGQIVFYTGDSDIFVPTKDNYLMVFYSSLQSTSEEVLARLNSPKNIDILIVDLAQDKKPSHNNTTYLTTGINNILKLVKLLRIEHSPSALMIKKHKNQLYKQSTLIEEI